MPVAGLRALAGIMIAMIVPCSMAGDLVRFDMPRQPLQAALDQYHDLTGQSLLYDGEIAEGKIVGPVQGDLTPVAALDNLLSGTGIVARYTSGNAFMLMRQTLSPTSLPSLPASTGKRDYYGRLQAQIAAALCSNAATIPGSYRLALNVWVGAGSAIDRVMLHPTGDDRRDARIRTILTGLALQSAPPAGVVQPITLVILPRAPAQTGDCDRASTAANTPVITPQGNR